MKASTDNTHATRVILLDIEGTTTPISFVYDTLFPYAAQELDGFVRKNWKEDELQQCVILTRQDIAHAAIAGEELFEWTLDTPDSFIACIRWHMKHDKKSTGLKQLQGLIWDGGYTSGAIKGEVFEDVPQAFEDIKACGLMICIYSSGSVAAQKLLFAHSTKGDLTVHLHDYFDTTTGPKKEPESYIKIAHALQHQPQHVWFLTDNLQEAWAAHKTNMRVTLLRRPGNPDLGEHNFDEITNLRPVSKACRANLELI